MQAKLVSEAPETFGSEICLRRSFENYYKYFRLLKLCSKMLWQKVDWYTLHAIRQSNFMATIQLFVTYMGARAQSDDESLDLLSKRCNLNFTLVMEMFKNHIINQLRELSTKDFQEKSDSTQGQPQSLCEEYNSILNECAVKDIEVVELWLSE